MNGKQTVRMLLNLMPAHETFVVEATAPLALLCRWAFIACFLFIANVSAGQDVLDNYVREGLNNNLVVQQRNITLKQARQSLQIARGLFLPSVTLLGDYLSAEGGRSINIPVGDLLNPVYTTLNQLTSSNSFPQIENVKQNFLPHDFYDARIRTSVPLVNTDLYFNRNIREEQVVLRQHELDIFKRQLVADIKTAYFNYLMATQAVKIYESARVLVNKNVEVNESLLKNGKTLPANRLRAKSESDKVAADLTGARNRQANARAYFNFLLNRSLDGLIEEVLDESAIGENGSMDSTTVSRREELEMLRTLQKINVASIRMNRFNRIPKVNAFIDLGSQAYNWKYNQQSRYYLFGVQFSMPLFQGFRNDLQVKQAKLEFDKTDLSITYTSKQLQFAAQVASNDLSTAAQNYSAAIEQLRSAQSYFNLVESGYQQGVNSLIEYLDARNQLTSSQLQRSLRWFEMLSARARLERETASYSFERTN